MQRVIVLGPPGSGKSTLARRIGRRHGLPVFHLDQVFWQPGWQPVPVDRFAAEVARISAEPAWVIDGNYSANLAPRLAAADTVVFLDVPRWLCMTRVLVRTALHWRRVRADSAPGCAERLDVEFLRFAWTWRRRARARYLDLVAGFPGHGVVVRSVGACHRLLD